MSSVKSEQKGASQFAILDDTDSVIEYIFKNEDETKERSLHTQLVETGYQAYADDSKKNRGSVAETPDGQTQRGRSRSPERRLMSGRSSSMPSRLKLRAGSSSDDQSARGTVAVTMSAGQGDVRQSLPTHGAEPMPRSSGTTRPIFTEAEQKIIEKGKEVAQKAVEVERAEYQVKLQQQATTESWNRTQQREEASKRMLLHGQQVQQELEQAKAAIVAETQVVEAQVAAEKDCLAQSQRAVEAERQRTLEIQAEVDRQVVHKQLELAEKEFRVAQESQTMARETEQKVAQIVSEFEARSPAAQAQLEAERQRFNAAAQAQIQKERQSRLTVESQKTAMEQEMLALKAQLLSKPEVFRMDVDDTVAAAAQNQNNMQVENDLLLAASLAKETHEQASGSDRLGSGTVAVTAPANQSKLGHTMPDSQHSWK